MPALLQGRTCDDNALWLVGNAKEVLDGVSKEEEADRALCAFHLMLFEGGCAKPDICGCERKKLKADKPVLWTVAVGHGFSCFDELACQPQICCASPY